MESSSAQSAVATSEDEPKVEADSLSESILWFSAPPRDDPLRSQAGILTRQHQCASCTDDLVQRLPQTPGDFGMQSARFQVTFRFSALGFSTG